MIEKRAIIEFNMNTQYGTLQVGQKELGPEFIAPLLANSLYFTRDKFTQKKMPLHLFQFYYQSKSDCGIVSLAQELSLVPFFRLLTYCYQFSNSLISNEIKSLNTLGYQ